MCPDTWLYPLRLPYVYIWKGNPAYQPYCNDTHNVLQHSDKPSLENASLFIVIKISGSLIKGTSKIETWTDVYELNWAIAYLKGLAIGDHSDLHKIWSSFVKGPQTQRSLEK